MLLAESDGGAFALINGLPVHPLVVHLAVVMVPLAAIGLIVMAAWPKFSRRWPVIRMSFRRPSLTRARSSALQ